MGGLIEANSINATRRYHGTARSTTAASDIRLVKGEGGAPRVKMPKLHHHQVTDTHPLTTHEAGILMALPTTPREVRPKRWPHSAHPYQSIYCNYLLVTPLVQPLNDVTCCMCVHTLAPLHLSVDGCVCGGVSVGVCGC